MVEKFNNLRNEQESGVIIPEYRPQKRAKRAGRLAIAGVGLTVALAGLEQAGAVELDELVVVVQETAGEVADELTE